MVWLVNRRAGFVIVTAEQLIFMLRLAIFTALAHVVVILPEEEFLLVMFTAV